MPALSVTLRRREVLHTTTDDDDRRRQTPESKTNSAILAPYIICRRAINNELLLWRTYVCQLPSVTLNYLTETLTKLPFHAIFLVEMS